MFKVCRNSLCVVLVSHGSLSSVFLSIITRLLGCFLLNCIQTELCPRTNFLAIVDVVVGRRALQFAALIDGRFDDTTLNMWTRIFRLKTIRGLLQFSKHMIHCFVVTFTFIVNVERSFHANQYLLYTNFMCEF